MAKGKINVSVENIFPLIKKFLYSDHEIFLRELISNGTDATLKLKHLTSIGEAKVEYGNPQLEVRIDKEGKKIHVIDQGIGMTADEVEKYINELAFSGAEDFLNKYDDDAKVMDTNDAWIQERTGIKERRHVLKDGDDSTTSMGVEAAKIAIERAGIDKDDIDFIVFATLSPDYYFPGPGVMVQRDLGIKTVGALDVRNQCSGFVYGISVADQYIKTGMYKNVLVIGSEVHSRGMDMTTRGRGVSVIFGDGAGAAILTREEDTTKGILSTHLHSEGQHAEHLALIAPGMGKRWVSDILADNDPEDVSYYPNMNGQFVFKNAVVRFSEVINEGLKANNLEVTDVDMLIPHQANLRISQFIQRKFGLSDDQVFNNIMKYGNTTAASIPIALTEAWEQGKVKDGDLVVLAAFGSGFTWGSVIIRW